MKENQHVQPVIDVEHQCISFNIADGKPALVLHMAKVHQAIIERAAYVGLAQVRVVDAAAIGAADDDGNILSPAERIAEKRRRMAELIEYLETGTDQWSRTGAGGGARSITVEAAARVRGVEYDVALGWIDEYASRKFAGNRKKALAKLREASDILRAIRVLRDARMPAARVDADAALAELGK